MSLQAFFQDDRDALLDSLEKNRDPDAAQAALDREIDRVMMRYVEQCPDENLRVAAQGILQSVKASLPLVGAVNDSRVWKKTLDTAGGGKKLPAKALAYIGAGAALLLASALAGALQGAGFAVLGALRALIPAALGGACLFRGGMLAAGPAAPSEGDGAGNVRVEYLIDPQKTWHLLRAAMVIADGQLSAAQEVHTAAHQAAEKGAAQAEPSGDMLELLSGLLEIAYSKRSERDADAAEMISAIRYYLHGAQVDAVDYDDVHDAWFEFLPSPKPGTMRPALVSGDRLLKKGLASA